MVDVVARGAFVVVVPEAVPRLGAPQAPTRTTTEGNAAGPPGVAVGPSSDPRVIVPWPVGTVAGGGERNPPFSLRTLSTPVTVQVRRSFDPRARQGIDVVDALGKLPLTVYHLTHRCSLERARKQRRPFDVQEAR